MPSPDRSPELLAPAGSMEALKAAVAAGADAVYLSGKRFGARRFAANFELPELEQALDYAHARGVRVYVTVNTLMHDRELSEVAGYLVELYRMGADAVLVQDPGVAALARELVPELELHASTQMPIHHAPGISWAAARGFKRAVLARELSLAEIEALAPTARDLGVGLEAFVHGALCYCFSGQCLLSSVMGGRSGNRGMCAQPCRKPYALMRGEQDPFGQPGDLQTVRLPCRYLLSTRDLCLYPALDRVAASPLQALKIEGRMRSPEYVALVVSIYRRALDRLAAGEDWSPDRRDLLDLALAFNREFTGGYLLGEKGAELMGRDLPDNRGVLLGVVEHCDPWRGVATVKMAGDLRPEVGDGLVFRTREEQGLVVHRSAKVEGDRALLPVKGEVPRGTRVMVTRRAKLGERARRIMESSRQIPLDLQISWQDAVPLARAAFPGPGGRLEVEVSGRRMAPAVRRPLAGQQIEAQLRRTGGTPFFIRRLDMSYPGGLYATLGELNQLRRDILAAAEDSLLQASRPDRASVAKAHARLEELRAELDCPLSGEVTARENAPYELTACVDSLEGVEGALEGGCDRICLEPRLGALADPGYQKRLQELLQEAAGLCRGRAILAWKWPRLTGKDFLDLAFPLLPGAGVAEVVVESLGLAEAILAACPGLVVSGSAGLNVWNHRTVRQLREMRRLTLSPELSAEQIAVLAARSRGPRAPGLEILAQGSLEVMVTKDRLLDLVGGAPAPFNAIRDARGIFPVYQDDQGLTHSLNSRETCLIDHLPRILEMGVHAVAIDARNRGCRYPREMAGIYREGLQRAQEADGSTRAQLEDLKERAARISLGGITAGHFLRGVAE
ncbi:MAG: peptidase U32 [Methanosarcinales archaeon]|nr:peptidase U32 [Methanosarcinales archaeon]